MSVIMIYMALKKKKKFRDSHDTSLGAERK